MRKVLATPMEPAMISFFLRSESMSMAMVRFTEIIYKYQLSQFTNIFAFDSLFLYFRSLLLLKVNLNNYFSSQNPSPRKNKMSNRKLSLASLMDNWNGSEVTLKAERGKIVVVTSQSQSRTFSRPNSGIRGAGTSNHRNTGPGVGLFSRLAQVGRDRGCQNYNSNTKVEPKFVIKPKSRSKIHRTSLADLSEIYSNSRINQCKPNNEINSSRKYSHRPPSQNTSGSSRKNISQHNLSHQKSEQDFNMKTGAVAYPRQEVTTNYHKFSNNHGPILSRDQEEFQLNRNIINQYSSQKHYPNHSNSQGKNYWQNNNNQAQDDVQKIKQSINQIRLPSNTIQCPKYQQANYKFENMKKQILDKIIQTGEINEYSDILRQIRQAANDIIAKHYPHQPPVLKKKGSHGVFSFNDTEPKLITLPPESPLALNPILEEMEDKSLQSPMVQLPQFKDDAGSISSILSLNKNTNSPKQDEQLCKIDNVFICDNVLQDLGGSKTQKLLSNQDKDRNYLYKEQPSDSSIKPIVLNTDEAPSQKQNKWMQVNDTQNNKNPIDIGKYDEQIKIEIKQSRQFTQELKDQIISDHKTHRDREHAFIFSRDREMNAPKPQNDSVSDFKKKYEKQYAAPITDTGRNYDLQLLSQQPMPIVHNLEEAKKFDPSVVKFTQLKAEYLETRTTAPEIIRIASPLRFRRKQQVVHCLVKNNLVERESNSIQF